MQRADGICAFPAEGRAALLRQRLRQDQQAVEPVEEADARGNLVPDAWFAALAVEAGCEWVTMDRDYARFAGLKWRLPSVNE